MTAPDTHRAIEAVFRIESPRLIAGLARIVRDVGLAEELAQDALVAALEQWPESGVPDNPGAWLMATAKNRAIDALRRDKLLERKHEELGHELEAAARAGRARSRRARIDDDVGDDLLRLVFTACHPVLSTEARVALTLRLLGGLTTEEIARAFLVPEPTIAQRIVRAKRTLAEARVPFEVPARRPSSPRGSSSVLEVVYLVFNEGYSATAGDDWMRPALCEDALRLGRILAELAPNEPEVHGLVALMEIQASRAARAGRPRRASRSCCSSRTARAGISCSSAAGSRRSRAPRRSAAPRGRTRCRRRSPRATRARARRRRRTGRASPRSTPRSPSCTPSPVVELNRAVAVVDGVRPGGGPRARRRARVGAGARRLSPPARACAAICSRSSAASTRRAPSSSARRR